MTNSFSAELPQDPQYYEYGIELGLIPLANKEKRRPILIGSPKEELLHLKGCHVKLDDERTLTASSLVTNSLTINNTPIKGVNDKQDPTSLVTLGGMTEYVKNEISSIKPASPWVINSIDQSISYKQGAVKISSLVFGESITVNMITDALLSAVPVNVEYSKTLPTAKAVVDYVKSYVKENSTGSQSPWKPNPSTTSIKGISYTADGNVGIGIDAPVAKLHVKGGAIMASSGSNKEDKNNGIVFSNNPGGGSFDSAWIRYYATKNAQNEQTERCVLEIGISNDAPSDNATVDHIAIMPSGLLGIGTTQPSLATVHIGASFNRLRNLTGGKYGFFRWVYKERELIIAGSGADNATLNTDGRVMVGTFNNNPDGTANYSLYAVGQIAALEYHALSDSRIKIIGGCSDGSIDLATLLEVQVTDYSYKDVYQQGSGQHKKLIGQQIAKVFPQAVKTHTDVIPDIYREATISDGWVQLPDHGLSVGERVRLFWNVSEPVIYKIEEASKNSFRVPLQFEGEIFVYGREVDDFHVVDYEAISMLHVSATQELYKIIQGLKQDVEDLKTQLATMNGTGLSPIAHA